jgi:hypothetical protein
LSYKAVHKWVEKFSHGHLKVADDEEIKMEVWKWLRQQSKDFYAADALVKRWDKRIDVGGELENMSRNKCFLQVPISYVLRFISIYDLFTGSP